MTHNIKNLYNSLPFKKEAFHLIRSFWSPPHNIYKHLYFNGQFNVKTKDYSFKLYHNGDFLENEIFWKGIENGYENTSLKLWAQLCKISENIIDIGANTGIYSLIAEASNPKATVMAFEPVKRVFKKLEENKRINDFKINCLNLALSNYNGIGTIFDCNSDHIYSVTINENYNINIKDTIKVEVPVKRLETIILENQIPKIDLIKIDVETHEPKVLEGMGVYIEKYQPNFIVEILSDEIAISIEKILGHFDYLYFDINENGTIKKKSELKKSTHFNYLICNSVTAKKLQLI